MADETQNQHTTTVKLEFYSDRPLTKEEVQKLHIHIYSQMTLNVQEGIEFLRGLNTRWSILDEKSEPVVIFDSIGRAYEP